MNHYLHMSFICVAIFMLNFDHRPTHIAAIQYAWVAMFSHLNTLLYAKITSKTTVMGKNFIFSYIQPNNNTFCLHPTVIFHFVFQKNERNEKQLLFVFRDSVRFFCCVFGCNCRLLYLLGICIQHVSVKILVKHE